jgi:hypothetical protein
MTAGEIARAHFAAAMVVAKAQGQDVDAVARNLLSLVISSMLERRSVEDVRSELLGAAENVNPDADYAFMRP